MGQKAEAQSPKGSFVYNALHNLECYQFGYLDSRLINNTTQFPDLQYVWA